MDKLFLRFDVENQIITRKDNNTLASKSKNYAYAHFNFLTSEWSGVKTAIFYRGANSTTLLNKDYDVVTTEGVSYKQVLDDNNECLIPWEVLVDKGIMYVSVYCNDLVTATRVPITISDSGYRESTTSSDSTLDEYSQLITKYNDLAAKYDLLATRVTTLESK